MAKAEGQGGQNKRVDRAKWSEEYRSTRGRSITEMIVRTFLCRQFRRCCWCEHYIIDTCMIVT